MGIRVNKRLWFALASVVLLLVLIALFNIPSPTTQPPTLSAAEQQWLNAHPTIRVATTPTSQYAPFSFIDSQGKPSGISPDYLRALSRQLGIHFQFVPTGTFADSLKAIRQHQVDLLMSVGKTLNRSRHLRFTQPYMKVPVAIIVRKAYKKQLTANALNGVRVAVGKDYQADIWLSQHYPAVNRVEVANDAIGLTRLSFGNVDAAIADLASASYVLRSQHLGNLRVAGQLDIKYDIRFAIRKDWPMLQSILNKGLHQLPASQRNAIKSRWISLAIPTPILGGQTVRWLLITAVLLLISLAVILLWNHQLRQQTRKRTHELNDQLEQRNAIEQKLRASEARWKFALEGAGSVVWDANLLTQETTYTKRWKEMLGYTDEELAASNWMDLVHPDDKSNVAAVLKRYLKSQDTYYRNEFRMRCKDGSYKWILSRAMAVSRDAQGHPQRLVGTNDDITERKTAELRIRHMAMHDSLTGLANRRQAQQFFTHWQEGSPPPSKQLLFIFIDVDNFKTINDSLGHQTGDRLLTALAKRLEHCLATGDIASRHGGDEFLTIAEIAHPNDEPALIEKLMRCLRDTYRLDGHEIHASVSAGISHYPEHGSNFETLARKADIALHNAKKAGRNTYCHFHDDMEKALLKRANINHDLQKALQRDEFVLYYQPQTDLNSGAIIGAEALIRWQHPTHGLISPAEFIPIAEESGHIVALGEWVLTQACQQAKRWQDADYPPLRLAINLSVPQFTQGNLSHLLPKLLKDLQLDASRLELEITESVFIGDIQPVLDALDTFHRMGIMTAIDDFGTGYSSLSYLKQLPVDKLKIDQSFIAELGDKATIAIVRSIISLAHGLNLQVIAEGVETREQRDWLRQAGCDQAQGYFYSQPLPASAFEGLLKEPSPR